jgi:DNA-binding transcriptional MocR family regulator
MYYIYCDFLERAGFEVHAVPEDGEGIRIDLLEQELERLGGRCRNISFIYIVTVNNPTCTILSNARRKELIETAARLSQKLNRTIPLILDKAYEELLHGACPERPVSGLAYDTGGLVYETATVSKIISPALRIGYMIGPDSPLLRALIQKTSDVGFSAPLFMQEIASYLLDSCSDDQMQAVNRHYREKARMVQQWIEELLSSCLERCTGGDAGFYYYLTFSGLETTEESPFFAYCSRTTGDPAIDGSPGDKNPRVIYVPGQHCVHPQGRLVEKGRRQLRLSYGFENLPQLHAALRIMKEAAEYSLQKGNAGA